MSCRINKFYIKNLKYSWNKLKINDNKIFYDINQIFNKNKKNHWIIKNLNFSIEFKLIKIYYYKLFNKKKNDQYKQINKLIKKIKY